jgi:ribosomal protein S18 acetylase RimI-like enzyme
MSSTEEVEKQMPQTGVHMMLKEKATPKKAKKKVVPKAVKAKPAVQKKQRTTKQTMEPLHYRPRAAQDDAYIVQLTRQQLGTVHERAFGQPFPDEQFLRYIQSGAPTVVIEQKGKPIGYYSYLVGQNGKMHISAMVIDPAHQSSGIGKMVMAKLEEDAAKQGVRVLEVFVQENNAQSLAFTRSLGFREVYRIEPNTIGFQKQLAPTS